MAWRRSRLAAVHACSSAPADARSRGRARRPERPAPAVSSMRDATWLSWPPRRRDRRRRARSRARRARPPDCPSAARRARAPGWPRPRSAARRCARAARWRCGTGTGPRRDRRRQRSPGQHEAGAAGDARLGRRGLGRAPAALLAGLPRHRRPAGRRGRGRRSASPAPGAAPASRMSAVARSRCASASTGRRWSTRIPPRTACARPRSRVCSAASSRATTSPMYRSASRSRPCSAYVRAIAHRSRVRATGSVIAASTSSTSASTTSASANRPWSV